MRRQFTPLGGPPGVSLMRMSGVSEARLLKGDVLDYASPPRSRSSQPSLKIRKHFPETWLWNQTNVGYGLIGIVINRMIFTKAE